MKKVIIVGGGPGGLAAGMILSHQGYTVDIYEKEAEVGGRNNNITLGEFRFDIGPTFLIYKKVLEEVFTLAGKNIEDYLELIDINPLYRLNFEGPFDFYPYSDVEKTYAEIAKVFPGEEDNYIRFLETEGKKFEAMIPCLEVPYSGFGAFFTKRFLRALPKLDLFRSLHSRLASYFRDHRLQIAMAFQSKYIGMSPWSCPAAFTILSYFEHKLGVHHVKGGLNQISKAMAKVIRENGGTIHLHTSIERIITENRVAKGIQLANGETHLADAIFVNADFAYAMTDLVSNTERKKYTDEKLKEKEYSCSTFMIYLGLDTIYENLSHHNIIFNKDYKSYVDNITKNRDISDDFSFYIHNPSRLDPTLAPAGKSALYILIPTPNNLSGIDWNSKIEKMEEKVFQYIAQRFGIHDLREHILEKRIITPNDWEHQFHIYAGATFNLSHKISQMLYFRPHNKFEDIENMYLVGGGTHPGSGLPTIYESAKISTTLFMNEKQ